MTDTTSTSNTDQPNSAQGNQAQANASGCACCGGRRGRCCSARRAGPLRWVVRIFLVVVLVFGIIAAYKAYRWHDMGESQRAAYLHQRIHEGVTQRLDLDAEQQLKLERLVDAAQVARSNVNVSNLRQRALTIISGQQLDQQAAKSLVDDLSRRFQAEAEGLLSELAAFYDSLSPEQQATLRYRLNGRYRLD